MSASPKLLPTSSGCLLMYISSPSKPRSSWYTAESPTWRPPVCAVSALTGAGLPELWQQIERHRAALDATGELAAKRQRQQVAWMWSMLDARLSATLRRHPAVRALLPGLEQAVADAQVTPTLAVDRILAAFDRGSRSG